ncbi:SDR family oxidoreductase [Rhizobacter sp. LjRoot28]|uniref:SDR family oxidoreductase n=1 Tax=Rhizobacter sp. LjRoot28 TaxID=3342309 RepID=UPI003ECEEA38
MTRPSVLVVGASRGIGLEFCRQYLAQGAHVVATARSSEGLAALSALGARALRLDTTRLDSTAGLAWQLDGERFDIAVLSAGVYGPEGEALMTPTEAQFDDVMHTNVLGPMRVIPQIADALAPGARLVVLSSRMGSIGARTATFGWLYRASKAALNSVLKDASLAFGDRATCVAVHPGWVQTDMGGGGADLTVEQSVSSLRTLIGRLGPQDTGRFLDHDGTAIPW